MAVFKLGDRLTIPGKNLKGEIAFIGETHFSEDIWFGVILDEPKGKHNGTVDGKRYFKCPKNHGMLIKGSYFERECYGIDNVVDKRRNLIPKALRNYQKANPKLWAAKNVTRKTKPPFQNRANRVLSVDNVANTKYENMQLTTITESGDNNNNNNASDGKKYPVRRYPNYLKASSKLTGSHYCLKKNKDHKTHHETAISDHSARSNDKNLVWPEGIPDKDDIVTPKRIVYPNYLKASSKLTGKHFCCDKNKSNHENVNDGGCKNISENIVEMQTPKGSTHNSISGKSYSVSNIMKCPNHEKNMSSFKGNRSCSAKRIEMRKIKSPGKNEGHKTPKGDRIQDIINMTAEREALKRENEDLRNKLESVESTLQEILSKLNKAEEEIKHLRYDNECQKKQIKFQKSHLKILKMQQSNPFKRIYSSDAPNRKTNEKKFDQLLESMLNEHSSFDANTSDKKIDLESIKAMTSVQHVLELEEKNRLMIQGLIELREFLKTQCESQPIETEPLNFSTQDRYLNRSNKKCAFPESFGSPSPLLNSKTFTTDESGEQLKDYSEILREMTKFNEVLKEKRRFVKDWDASNFAAESLRNADLPQKHDSGNTNQASVHQSTQSSTFDTVTEHCTDPMKAKMDHGTFRSFSTLMKNENQSNYQKEVIDSLQYFPSVTKTNEKIHKQHMGNGVAFESVDNINEPIYNDFYHLPTTTAAAALNGQEKEISEFTKNSRNLEMVPGFSVDLRSQSTDIGIRPSDDSPIEMPKSKNSAREMGSMKK